MISYYRRPGTPATQEALQVRCRPLRNEKGDKGGVGILTRTVKHSSSAVSIRFRARYLYYSGGVGPLVPKRGSPTVKISMDLPHTIKWYIYLWARHINKNIFRKYHSAVHAPRTVSYIPPFNDLSHEGICIHGKLSLPGNQLRSYDNACHG